MESLDALTLCGAPGTGKPHDIPTSHLMRASLTLLISLALLAACEKTEPSGADLAPEPTSNTARAEDAPREGAGAGAFGYSALRVGSLPGPEAAQGAPTNDEVEAILEASLKDASSLTLDPDALPLDASWALRVVEKEGEQAQVFAAVQVLAAVDGAPQRYGTTALRAVDEGAPEAAGPSGPVRTPRALLERVAREAVAELDQDVAVRAASDAELAGLLRQDTLLLGLAARRALERAKPAVVSGELPGGVGIMRRYLKHERPEAVLTAAAAIVQAGDEASAPMLVEAAATLSRASMATPFTAMLFLLGDLDAPEGDAYLESICAGHPNDEVRSDACQALGKE
jgi:hypothetical protein